jgi:cytidylate kinase
MMRAGIPVVTIDGPSGSGKGTVARALAQRLGWHLLDSGALYRLIGLVAARRGIEPTDTGRLVALAGSLNPAFAATPADERVWLDGEEVSAAIRSERSGELASQVAQLGAVRTALLDLQRASARPPGLVADGRDMGTVVFPEALLKVFLSASADERAMRRYKQLKEKGIDVSLRDLSRDIEERDSRDAERSVAPLRAARGACLIDSTELTADDVVEKILARLRQLGASS